MKEKQPWLDRIRAVLLFTWTCFVNWLSAVWFLLRGGRLDKMLSDVEKKQRKRIDKELSRKGTPPKRLRKF